MLFEFCKLLIVFLVGSWIGVQYERCRFAYLMAKWPVTKNDEGSSVRCRSNGRITMYIVEDKTDEKNN